MGLAAGVWLTTAKAVGPVGGVAGAAEAAKAVSGDVAARIEIGRATIAASVSKARHKQHCNPVASVALACKSHVKHKGA